MTGQYTVRDRNGAKAKAWWLNSVCHYNIISIRHTISGYSIYVHMNPTVLSNVIPNIIEA